MFENVFYSEAIAAYSGSHWHETHHSLCVLSDSVITYQSTFIVFLIERRWLRGSPIFFTYQFAMVTFYSTTSATASDLTHQNFDPRIIQSSVNDVEGAFSHNTDDTQMFRFTSLMLIQNCNELFENRYHFFIVVRLWASINLPRHFSESFKLFVNDFMKKYVQHPFGHANQGFKGLSGDNMWWQALTCELRFVRTLWHGQSSRVRKSWRRFGSLQASRGYRIQC